MRQLDQNIIRKKRGRYRPLIIITLIALLMTGCGKGGVGALVNAIGLPLDFALNLFCPDVGIAFDKCILDDPDNPYAGSLVNDQTKWDLYEDSPSAKSDFYLWATALARNPSGENQYYTALSLHDLFTQGNSNVARDQAKRAYRSLLDNFFDSVTFFEGSPTLDLLPDVDFRYGEFGSGSQLDGGYRDDPDFSPVFEVERGFGYGAAMALVSFSGINTGNGMLAGFSTNYTNLVFKIKNLPTGSVWVTFASFGNPQLELEFDLATYAVDIPGTTGWKEVTIPLAMFPDRASYTEFAIHGGFGNDGTFLFTDIAFTGDETGAGLVNDVDDNGFVYLYRSGTQLISLVLRHLAGRNLYDPASQNLLQLYQDRDEAMNALMGWGYQYDPATQMVDRL